jgi:hypothetical protein
MFEYFYHEILRRTIISFGTLFNSISIQKKDENDNITEVMQVPLAYGPTQKFLSRLEQSPDLNKPIQITLPRMSFEFSGLSYDNSRKLAPTQSFTTTLKNDTTDIRKAYLPVPYNMDFELSIMTQFNDEMLQIIEQILPYFQPSFILSVDLVKTIGEKRDIPLTLENISMQDDYEGDFTTRRALIYTLKFTAKTYLFGPISGPETSKDIIKKVSIGLVSGDSTSSPRRDVTYSVDPTAIKNYTGDIVTNLSTDIKTSDVIILVDNASDIPEKSYITLNDETIYVKSKSNNSLVVTRGSYGTQISSHVLGTSVKKITEEDNDLIPTGDDFGFSGSL